MLFSISAGVIQIGSFAILEIFIKDYWIPYLISLVFFNFVEFHAEQALDIQISSKCSCGNGKGI